MNLYENLDKYRLLTLKLIDEVENDGNLDSLIQERENILRFINESDFDKEKIKAIGSGFKLLELENKVQDSIKKEKVKVMRQLEQLKKIKQVNLNYNYNAVGSKTLLFNKTI